MKRFGRLTRLTSVMALSATLLAGCFGGGGGIGGSPDEPVKLVMWGLFDDPAVWQPIIERYELRNPGITIEYVKKDFADYELDSLDELASRTGPDIWMIRSDWIPQHYNKLVAAPEELFAQEGMSALAGFRQQFPDVTYRDAVVGNEIYGVPLSVDTLILYYNETHFQERRSELDQAESGTANSNDLRNAPVTWNDVIRYADLLEKRDGAGRITRSGIALGANNVDQSQDVLAALMLQRDTEMVSSDRKSATFNLPRLGASGASNVPGKDALDFFRSFSDPTHPRYSWPSDFPNSVEAFKQGKVSMILHYGYLQNRLQQEAPTLDFGIYALPQIDGAIAPSDYASYWLHTVTRASKNPAIAWNFLASTLGDASSYQGAAGRPGNDRPNELIVPETMADRAGIGDPLDFQRASGKSWYKGRRPLKVDAVLRDVIQAVVNGDDPQHALDAGAARITNLLQNQSPAPAAAEQ